MILPFRPKCVFLLWLGLAAQGHYSAWAQSGYARLKSFGSPELPGSEPLSPLIQGPDGAIYGTTSFGGKYLCGGSNYGGTAYRYDPLIDACAVLIHFNHAGGDGGHPRAGLLPVLDGETWWLFGTTAWGGGSSDRGTVFKVKPDGSSYTRLINFTRPDIANAHGPFGTLVLVEVQATRVLFGPTYLGGRNGRGTIFKVNLDGTGYDVLHHFGGAGDGELPTPGLIQATDGNLYGTTVLGGTAQLGTVIKFVPNTGSCTVIHHFSSSIGAYPFAGLVQAKDGKLYGVTRDGGNGNGGVVFSVDLASGLCAKVCDLGGSPQGPSNPEGSMAADEHGFLYGLGAGGKYGRGAVFKVDPSKGSCTVLYSFSGSTDGSNPAMTGMRGPVLASDGALYGTTIAGGDFGKGTLWRYGLNTSPVAQCQNITVSAEAGQSSAAVEPQQVDKGSYDPDGDTFTLKLMPSGPYPVGTTSVTLTATDNHGASSQCAATITVINLNRLVVMVSTLAGSGVNGYADGVGTNAQFSYPNGGSIDTAGNLYIADWGTHRIRKVSPDGTVSTLAGTGVAGHQDGPAHLAQFNSPIGLCVDLFGNVFVTDMGDNRIRKITPEGTVSTVAGSGVAGYLDGPGSSAQFNFPNDVAVAPNGTLWVSEFNNHTVRQITPEGMVSTWIGNGTPGYADGPRTSARLNQPSDVERDPQGNLYVTEFGNQRIRKISVAGEVTTVAGSGLAGYVDGLANQAQFRNPDGVVIDANGYLWVADNGNHVIRRISPTGWVETVAGTGVKGFADGEGAKAQFSEPGGIGMDVYGNLYVPEWSNHRVRKIMLGGPVVWRQLPTDYAPGIPVTVTLMANPWTTTVTYAVEDQPPTGWTISSISLEGVFDTVNQKVKFGPFLDATPRTLSYVATPPSQEQGLKSFTGLVSLNGADKPIEGVQALPARPFHPADRSPGDWQMSISEMTAYSGAWKRGTTWAVGPNPIPIGYMTRAALLWKGGESYGYDRMITIPPLCWVNLPRLGLLGVGSPARILVRATTPATTSSATAQMETYYRPGQPMAVTIAVIPAASVMAYAVEDQPPKGWGISAITHEGVCDTMTEKVKWGPFFDAQFRALSYQATPPLEATDTMAFHGTVSWEGLDEVIGGQRLANLGVIPPPRLAVSHRGVDNSGFSFSWQGEPGAVYEVLVSGDLKSWSSLFMITNFNEDMSITDPAACLNPQRFYRVKPR